MVQDMYKAFSFRVNWTSSNNNAHKVLHLIKLCAPGRHTDFPKYAIKHPLVLLKARLAWAPTLEHPENPSAANPAMNNV
jgi:hypothetical protein